MEMIGEIIKEISKGISVEIIRIAIAFFLLLIILSFIVIMSIIVNLVRRKCPYCSSSNIKLIKKDYQNRKAAYFCNSCNKEFSVIFPDKRKSKKSFLSLLYENRVLTYLLFVAILVSHSFIPLPYELGKIEKAALFALPLIIFFLVVNLVDSEAFCPNCHSFGTIHCSKGVEVPFDSLPYFKKRALRDEIGKTIKRECTCLACSYSYNLWEKEEVNNEGKLDDIIS